MKREMGSQTNENTIFEKLRPIICSVIMVAELIIECTSILEFKSVGTVMGFSERTNSSKPDVVLSLKKMSMVGPDAEKLPEAQYCWANVGVGMEFKYKISTEDVIDVSDSE